MNMPDESLNHALNALREYLQGNSHDLATLRETSYSSEQRLGQLTAEVEIVRQELQGIQQNNSELERSLRIQWVKAREQLDAHTGELATLSKLNERASSLEQQLSASQTQAADTLRVDQNRLAALEKWLTTQAEQFGRFDPILRELHSELVSAHQRLAALESAGGAEALDHHARRLSEAEQSVHDQSNALGEIQQTLEQLATQAPATAKLNKTLIGALAVAGVIIIGLLVMLAAG